MTGSLSQEEIDALLAGGSGPGGQEPEAAEDAAAPVEAVDGRDDLGAAERDAIGEVGNICMSSAATVLSALLGHPVSITTPSVDIVDASTVRAGISRPAAVTFIDFTQGLSGQNVLILGNREAGVVADLMMGQAPGTGSDTLDELQLSAVSEAMNQMMGSASTAMAQMLGIRVDITAPRVRVLDPSDADDTLGLPEGKALVRVQFQLRVGDLIDTALMQLMPVPFASALVSALVSSASAGADAPGEPLASPSADGSAVHEAVPPAAAPAGEEPAAAAAPAASAPAAPAAPVAPVPPAAAAPPASTQPLSAVPPPVVQPVNFPSLADAAPATPAGDMALLLDVPLQVTVELGRTRMRIREVLDLAPGSIIELDRIAGEPVDVLVNGKQIARGEVVVINEEFGVRITEVAHPATRLRGVAAQA
jgi:flagellar motor switch protein FliN